LNSLLVSFEQKYPYDSDAGGEEHDRDEYREQLGQGIDGGQEGCRGKAGTGTDTLLIH
jgi:hypothetical protein